MIGVTVPNVTKKKEGKKEVNWPRGCYSFSSVFFSNSFTETEKTENVLQFFSTGKPGVGILAPLLRAGVWASLGLPPCFPRLRTRLHPRLHGRVG